MILPKITSVVDYKTGLQRSRIDIIICMLNISWMQGEARVV